MAFEQTTSLDNPLLKPLWECKERILKVLVSVGSMQGNGVRFDPERVFIIEQLDFAVDNMIRILVSGILKAEMEGLFEEKATAMIAQAEEFKAGLTAGLDEGTVGEFEKMIHDVDIDDGAMLSGVRDQLIDDHGLYLSFLDGEIRVSHSPPSAAH